MDFRGDKIQKASDTHGLTGSLGVVGGTDVARTGPKVAGASLEYHRSIFWAMGKGWKAEIWHAGGHGHGKANGDGWRWSGPTQTGPGLAPSSTGPSSGP